MLNREIREELRAICGKCGGTVLFGHPLGAHSTISIGGKASAWFVPSSLEGLCITKSFLEGAGVRTVVIGRGSNVLIPDEGLDAVVINLSDAFFSDVRIEGRSVTAGAGARLGRLVSLCCMGGLGGLEGLIGVPGTVGGAVFMNASYRGAASDFLEKVQIVNGEGQAFWMEKKELEFEYRGSSVKENEIITRVVFRLEEASPGDLNSGLKSLFAEKAGKQPLGEKTLGCIFKNPTGSGSGGGELIDKSGMKGYRRGGAKVSEKHANFIVNCDRASFSDVTSLMNDVRRKVLDRFSVELEPEIRILGN
ncbi:MAG: UDP-N-acetylmuramate dehydrogenase [Candidatus Omnitrophota bacterium]|nr:UDP-N-acetylmuramate dehydrogenase [Candidatus Omnitrophota bacterium]